MEILNKKLRQCFCLFVVGVLIFPSISRVKYFYWDTRACFGHEDTETGMACICLMRKISLTSGLYHRTGIAYTDPISDAIGSSCPARVYQPDVGFWMGI